jgi:hypothetical protein
MATKKPAATETFEDRLLNKRLKVKDLIATNDTYKDMINEWTLLLAVYEGIREIIRKGYIERHEREYKETYIRRIKELYGLGYTESIVNIFHFYLFKKSPQHTLGALGKDKIWEMFAKDADLSQNPFETVVMEFSLYASVFGCVGILVDKADTNSFKISKGKKTLTKQDELDNEIYPYIAKYFPTNILDWSHKRDEFNRPYLAMVKLLDDDGTYRIWTPEFWQKWEFPKDKDGKPDQSNYEKDAVLLGDGKNTLGFIPFFWHYNKKSRKPGVGISDVHETARIDLSIIRNLSQIEEIIYFAAFPMMRKPIRSVKPTDQISQQDDETGPSVVLEFDPDKPESKPDWLETPVAESIAAIIDHIKIKIGEAYRATNTGGLTATDTSSKEARSGVALKTEFQLLNSQLVSKGINLEKSERRIVEYWLKWQLQFDQLWEEVDMARDRTYDVEDLATDLENILTSKKVVMSETFNKLLQKRTARKMLPGAAEDDLELIDKEIEEYKEPEPPKFSDESDVPPVPGKNPDIQIDPEKQPGKQNQQSSNSQEGE